MPPCGLSGLRPLRMPWTDAQRSFFLSQDSVKAWLAGAPSGGSPGTSSNAVDRAVDDGMVSRSPEGWETVQAWFSASRRERIRGDSPGVAAWWDIRVFGADQPQGLSQNLATLVAQGQITQSEADSYAVTAGCLGLPLVVAVGSSVTTGPIIQDRIIVSTTVQNPDGSVENIGSEDPRFADAVAALPPLADFGAGPVTRTIVTSDGKTITSTSVPAGDVVRNADGSIVPIITETAEDSFGSSALTATGAAVGTAVGGGALAGAVGLSVPFMIGLGLVALVVLVSLSQRKG